MKFAGTAPFTVGFPTTSVGTADIQFDLHNDATLRELTLDRRQRSFTASWSLKEPAWKVPDLPITVERRTVADVSLVLSDIESVTVSGELLNVAGSLDSEFDFLEFSRLSADLGEVRIVLQNAAEITVVARRCALNVVGAP
jgi:hypothetical protein